MVVQEQGIDLMDGLQIAVEQEQFMVINKVLLIYQLQIMQQLHYMQNGLNVQQEHIYQVIHV